MTGETRVYLGRMLERFGAVLFEPWMDRHFDLGVCARLAAGRVTAEEPHTLLVDERGGFLGIDLAPPPLTADERDELDEAVAAAGAALALIGYEGPFTVDAFVHGEPRRLHPLCEINARYSFGHVARALAVRDARSTVRDTGARALGGRVLGFGAPPAGAEVLVAPTADDPFTAWRA